MKRGPDASFGTEIESAAARWVARRDAGLSPAGEREMQRWLEADPRHREALAFYGSAWAALARPAQTGAGAELENQLATFAGRRTRRRYVTAAAMTAVVLGISIAAWNRPRPAAGSPPPSAVVVIPAHESLPDGSTVELNRDAQVAVEYSATSRRVILRNGEAHFSVQKDPGRPFIVSAGGVDVRAVGTAFLVQLGSASVDVVVTEGKVSVAKPGSEAAAPVSSASAAGVAVEAGRRVVVGIAPSAEIPAASDMPVPELNARLAWRSARLEFTRTPLAEAVDLLNRHSPPSAARLVIADSAVAAMKVSGVFRPDNTEAFVLLLEGAFGVKADRTGNTIALSKAR